MEAILTAIIGAVIAALGAILGAILGVVVQSRLSRKRMADRDIFSMWRIAFDRGAFRGSWRWPASALPLFEEAIRQVSLAVNTGQISNTPLQGQGKSALRNPARFARMEEVTRRLDRILIQTREFEACQDAGYESDRQFAALWQNDKKSEPGYKKALQEHQKAQDEREQSLREIAKMVDTERDEIIKILNEIWRVLKIPLLPIPTEMKEPEDFSFNA